MWYGNSCTQAARRSALIIKVDVVTFEGETLVFRMEYGYSLEKFHSSMLVDLSCQLQSWEKICNWLKNYENHVPSKILPYTVVEMCDDVMCVAG